MSFLLHLLPLKYHPMLSSATSPSILGVSIIDTLVKGDSTLFLERWFTECTNDWNEFSIYFLYFFECFTVKRLCFSLKIIICATSRKNDDIAHAPAVSDARLWTVSES